MRACLQAIDKVMAKPQSVMMRLELAAALLAHARYVTFQLAEVAVTHDLFRKVLRLIDELRPPPTPA
ncbi:MAG: hypothetical protein ACR2OF_08425 [Hyphomicrobium sp.]